MNDIERVAVTPFFHGASAYWEVRTIRTDQTSYTVADIAWREPGYRLAEDPPLWLYLSVNPGAKDPREAEAVVEAINAALKWRQDNPDGL